MKKIFAIILAVAMLATMSVTAFAAESATNDGTSNTSINVKGTYVAAQGAGEKISVDVAWEGMEFTYTEGTAGEWLPGQHKYADNAAGSWSTNKGKITVTNHSNVAVTATLSFATNVEGVNGTFTETSGTENDKVLELATAVDTTFNAAPSATAEFGISGAAITETKDTLGTITVAIAANGPTVVTTEQELRDAIAQGGKIKLGDSFTMASYVDIRNNVTLDLNNKTLTFGSSNGFYVYDGATLNVSNGTIISSSNAPVYNYDGTVSVENCTLTGHSYAYLQEGGASSLRNCIANGYISTDGDGGTVTLYESITFGHGTHDKVLTGIMNYGGSVICHFDPTDHIKIGSLSDNNDGTWTVSPEAE